MGDREKTRKLEKGVVPVIEQSSRKDVDKQDRTHYKPREQVGLGERVIGNDCYD